MKKYKNRCNFLEEKRVNFLNLPNTHYEADTTLKTALQSALAIFSVTLPSTFEHFVI